MAGLGRIPLSVPRLSLRAAEVVAGLFLPSRSRPFPISDRSRDDGLFGPGSVTWRVMREPLLTLAAGRALLMQAAHPLVAQGAIDHSTYATDPFGRFDRTVTWVTQVCFGSTAEAERAISWVNRLHTHVSGSLPGDHATAVMQRSTAYSARDPQLLRWVHATFVDTMIASHDALIGGLSDDERDTFVREWDTVGRLLGVPKRLRWRDYAAMRRYIERSVTRGETMPGAGSRLVSRTVLHPPLAAEALRPAVELLAFTAVGLLDERMRRAYRITWTPAHSAAHSALCLWMRTVKHVLPHRLRSSPLYEFALARARGELEQAA